MIYWNWRKIISVSVSQICVCMYEGNIIYYASWYTGNTNMDQMWRRQDNILITNTKFVCGSKHFQWYTNLKWDHLNDSIRKNSYSK